MFFTNHQLLIFQDALVKPTEEQYDLLVKKMQYLIEMGNGETILEVGAGEGMNLKSSLYFLEIIKL